MKRAAEEGGDMLMLASPFKLTAAASSAALMAAITASSAGWPLRCAATDRRK